MNFPSYCKECVVTQLSPHVSLGQLNEKVNKHSARQANTIISMKNSLIHLAETRNSRISNSFWTPISVSISAITVAIKTLDCRSELFGTCLPTYNRYFF